MMNSAVVYVVNISGHYQSGIESIYAFPLFWGGGREYLLY